MKFLVCKKQHGYGCDYTIGCGMHFDYYEAEDKDSLIESLIYPDGRDEYSSLEGDNMLSDLLIIDAEHVSVININEIKQNIERQRAKEQAINEIESDEAEFERLRKKLGR